MNTDDLHKDAQEAMERDNNIQRGRIMKILNLLVGRMTVVCCLPELIENKGHVIAHLYDSDELALILKACHKYKIFDDDYDSTTDSIYSEKTRNSKKRSIMLTRVDPKLAMAVRQLYKNDRIVHFAICLAERPIPGDLCSEFLNQFKQLRDIIQQKIFMTSDDQRNFEKRLGKLWKQNEFYKTVVTDRLAACKQLDKEFEIKLNERHGIINELINKLDNMREKNRDNKMRIINVSERTMATNNAVSTEKTEDLDIQARQITHQYDTLLDEHMKEEKLLRIKRYKIETVLANWLSKFDVDIGELQRLYEIELNGWTEEKERMDDLEARFTIQEEEYIVLMQEKAIEEQRLFDEKLVAFIRLLSAKKIQRWWRAILARRYRRKKKRGKGKGKGKKKR